MVSNRTTQNIRYIQAAPEVIYHAFTDPGALAEWFAPGDMTAQVHGFDLRVGGGYEMSLFYPADDLTSRGKTAAKEDHYTAHFIEIAMPHRIVEAIRFDSDDPSFDGEMIMVVSLEPQGEGTLLTIEFQNIPDGIRLEDNEEGTRLSLEKLAKLVEG